VLTGGGDFSDVPSGVEARGHVPRSEVVSLLQRASALVFPSLYEGFGLPPLEAMASGTPVVTSNVSSLPEVAGDAAVLVDPYDPQAIADGIYRVLTDERLRREMVHKGIARAGQFSWEQSARRTHAIYEEAGA
jgi:glycosyltransferase involved in cell wall biosynthesis